MNFSIEKKKGTYSLEEIDKKLDLKMRKITGDELNKTNQETYDKALIWGSLDIYLSDKKFIKIEKY